MTTKGKWGAPTTVEVPRADYNENGCPNCGSHFGYPLISGGGLLVIECVCKLVISLVDHSPTGGGVS